MEDVVKKNLIGRWPKFSWSMEDDIDILKKLMDDIFFMIVEDDYNLYEFGRQTQFG